MCECAHPVVLGQFLMGKVCELASRAGSRLGRLGSVEYSEVVLKVLDERGR